MQYLTTLENRLILTLTSLLTAGRFYFINSITTMYFFLLYAYNVNVIISNCQNEKFKKHEIEHNYK